MTAHQPAGLPGFFDLQVNGYLGVDFSDPALEAEQFRRACRTLLARGTAGFLPTIITGSMGGYRRNLPIIAAIMAEDEFAGCLPGIHLEGPFLSSEPGAVGAHNPQWVQRPSIEVFDELAELCGGRLRMLTLAAELPGAEALCRHAVDAGVCVSLGHHLAGPDELQRLIDAGARSLTHLGNGLPNLVDRHRNPIWEGLAADDLTATIIADGHHLPAGVLKVFLRAKGVGRAAIISDASPVAGLPPGEYHTLGNVAVLEPSGLLHSPAKQCMVGSSANMLDCMNVVAALGEFGLDELMRLGRANPLALVGLNEGDLRGEQLLSYDAEARRFNLTT